MLHDERVIPEKVEHGVLAFHLKRYRWAQEFSHNKVILDVGCGVGYGTSLLAEAAKWVVGVDYDWDAIDYARRHYQRWNLSYAVMDCRWLGFPDGCFELITSFEVYEHLPQEAGKMFLGEVKRILRPGGSFLMSTPNAATWGIYWRQSKHRL